MAVSVDSSPKSRWRGRPTMPQRTTVNTGVVVVGLILVAALAGTVASRSSKVTVGLTAVILMAGLASRRGLVLALALPSAFLESRLGGASVNLSLADAFLVGAVIVALPHVDWSRPRLRRVIVLSCCYLVMLGVNVVAVPNRAAYMEWGHRAVLVIGAVLVGAAIAETGRTVLALRALLVTAAFFAVAAVATAAQNGLEPAYPFGYHKNFVGPLLAMALLVVVGAGSVAKLSPVAQRVLFGVLVAGILATQSRAAMMGLAVGLIVLMAKVRHLRRGLPLFVMVTATFAWVVARTLERDTTGVNDTAFNPVRSRLTGYEVALDQWRANPWFGAGVRWFKYPGQASPEPHSAVFATLSETGLWGAAATVALFLGALLIFRNASGPLAAVATAVLCLRIVESQVAIFWLAGTMTLPWLLVGLAAVHSDEDERVANTSS